MRVCFLVFIVCLVCLMCPASRAQSVELMPGLDGVFADVQFLKPFRQKKFDWSIFSRTRALVDYELKTDIFSALYLNYTTKPGIGATVIGKVGTQTAGGDGGIHYFQAKEKFVIYALLAAEMKKNPGFYWFSIARYRPKLTAKNDKWKWYTSLELFTQLNTTGHLYSVQRVRGGFDYNKWQFGLALNIGETGKPVDADFNPGVFGRREF